MSSVLLENVHNYIFDCCCSCADQSRRVCNTTPITQCCWLSVVVLVVLIGPGVCATLHQSHSAVDWVLLFLLCWSVQACLQHYTSHTVLLTACCCSCCADRSRRVCSTTPVTQCCWLSVKVWMTPQMVVFNVTAAVIYCTPLLLFLGQLSLPPSVGL